MRALLTDLRLAARSFRKERGFTAAAVLTLSLGMTLSTLTLVVLNAYLLEDLPYPHAERLHYVRYAVPGQDQPRGMERLDWASLGDVIEYPIAWDLDVFYMLGGDQTESVPGAWVTPGFMEGLGVRPALGAGFDPAAFKAGGVNVALISHRLWNSRFNADPSIVGRAFTAYVSDRPEEAESFVIGGVLPADFWHINTYTDILAPLREATYPYMVRLRRGVTPDAAAARITALVKSGAREVPPLWSARVVSAHEQHVAVVRPALSAVSGAAALVLLVACGNAATLLLMRATRRQKEIAVRAALGAGRAAIARMLLAEAVVLGAGATVVSLFVTWLMLDSLAPHIQQQLGRSVPGGTAALAIDARLLMITAATGLVTAVLCAMGPLVTALRPRLAGALQSGSRGATEGRRSQRIRAGLIALEIAASVTLVAGSTLMLRSVITLLRTDLGFQGTGVLNVSATLRAHRYPDAQSRLAVFDRTLARLSSIAGAESVALTSAWPLQQGRMQPVDTEGSPRRAGARSAVHHVTEGYFSTLRIPPAAGRTFTHADRLGAEPVAVISDTLARRLWAGGNPLGSRIVVPEEREGGEPVPISRRVVGVVRDVRQFPADVDLADVYVPFLQAPGRFAFILVRTAGAPLDWVPPVQTALREIDPEISVARGRALQTLIEEATSRPRFLVVILASFAAAAGLLALMGVYGVVAYAVRQREREIAVRLAIGADPTRITRLFLRQGGVILLAGLILGVAGALGAGRVIESQLVGVTPRDPVTLGAAALAFAAAGLLAIWWPSRRAGATEPAIALRSE
jgi:predicted permease